MKQIRATNAVPEDQKLERRSECFEEKSGKPEEVEGREERKDQRPPCLQRRWGRNQIAEGRKASEEKIRRGREDARSSSDESDNSDVSWHVVREKKKTRETSGKTMKKTDGREVEQQKKHDDERSTIKTDKDKDEDKDIEHELCVSSWNVNKSSARYDFCATWLSVRLM